jgi:transposase
LGERLFACIREAAKIHDDDTPVTLLGNGDGSRTGHFWVYLRDDRSSGAMCPPAVAFRFSADRSGTNPAEHLAGYQGYLPSNGLAG